MVWIPSVVFVVLVSMALVQYHCLLQFLGICAIVGFLFLWFRVALYLIEKDGTHDSCR